jgi:FAD/FMN-containing dehydrogenase
MASAMDIPPLRRYFRGVNHPIVAQIQSQFPAGFISVEPSELREYGKDWTKVYEPNPSAICFPSSTEEVSRLLAMCSAAGVPVVPSGGRTGLAGGAVAASGEVVLSLSRMRKMGEIDRLAHTMECEAGAITEAVHEHAREAGLAWPIDFAAKGSSCVGGNIATNAGGVKVIRYGLTRNWVLGLTVVLMDGTVLRLNGSLEKNNTGVDLRQLFIGTEGILGVITECVLKLAPLPRESDVFFFALSSLPEVFRLFEAARMSGFTLNAFECLSQSCLDVVLSHRGLSAPLAGSNAYYVLCEVERPESEDARGRLETWLGSLFESGLVQDAVLAQSPKEASNLWAMREGISESLAATGLLHKHDISLPIHRLQEFIEVWTHDLTTNYSGLSPYIFGHIGDGNLHVNLMKPADMEVPAFRALCAQVDQNMFGWIQKFEGSVSAEHGIGLLKKHLLGFTRAPAEIALMRQMKAIFDPKNLLNPGKVI